jgi:Ca2+-binding RTX toxin-like protein
MYGGTSDRRHRGGSPRRRPRPLLAVAAITAAGLLGAAAPALADTTVSVESGSFGSGLSGTHLFVRDTTSLFDQRMDVRVAGFDNDDDNDIDEIHISDRVGRMRIDNNTLTNRHCRFSGAEVHCNRSPLVGLKLEGSDLADILTNASDLPAAILGDRGVDLMQGGSSEDQMNGQDGNDTERGGAGVDRFGAEPGDDILNGQTGDSDSVSYAGASGPVALSLENESNPDGISGESDRLVDVENATGSGFSDSMGGSAKSNVLRGGLGRDTLDGREGDDVLDGGEEGDIIRGGDGANDRVTYANRTLPVSVTLDDRQGDGNPGTDGTTENVDDDIENIDGGAASDTLRAQSAKVVANTINGGAGDDVLDGGLGGNDRLDGQAGNDQLGSSFGDDVLLGGNDDDTLAADSGNDTLKGQNGDDRLDGGNGGDEIDGGADNGSIRQVVGDIVDNGDGDLVTYIRPPNGDTIFEEEDITVTLNDDLRNDGGVSDGPVDQRDVVLFVERVTTGGGKDTIIGGDEEEALDGGGGDDHLAGNAGNDKLTGGEGIDGLSGGSGADHLVANDRVADFPLDCGVGPNRAGEDFATQDVLDADLVDLFANPPVGDPDADAFCEIIRIR